MTTSNGLAIRANSDGKPHPEYLEANHDVLGISIDSTGIATNVDANGTPQTVIDVATEYSIDKAGSNWTTNVTTGLHTYNGASGWFFVHLGGTILGEDSAVITVETFVGSTENTDVTTLKATMAGTAAAVQRHRTGLIQIDTGETFSLRVDSDNNDDDVTLSDFNCTLIKVQTDNFDS